MDGVFVFLNVRRHLESLGNVLSSLDMVQTALQRHETL